MKSIKFKGLALRVMVLALTLLAMTTGAWADIVPVGITGTIWSVPGNLQNAPITNPTVGPAVLEGTFTASKIDFNTGTSGTLSTFLNFDGSATSIAVSAAALGAQMSTCSGTTTTGGGCLSTVIHISGTATFTAGDTYTLWHDDGVNMFVNGVQVINAPGPVVETPSSFTGAGLVNSSFDIYYMATNQNPEVLRLEHTPVPEPASILGLGTVLFLLGSGLRRKLT
jgi:hypothetical protein